MTACSREISRTTGKVVGGRTVDSRSQGWISVCPAGLQSRWYAKAVERIMDIELSHPKTQGRNLFQFCYNVGHRGGAVQKSDTATLPAVTMRWSGLPRKDGYFVVGVRKKIGVALLNALLKRVWYH